MDYHCNFQGGVLGGPGMDERYLSSSICALGSGLGFPLGSFQHLPKCDPPFPPESWSNGDPTLLRANEHESSNSVKIPPTGNLGVDTGGNLTYQQRPQVVKQNSQFRIRSDMMLEAMCGSFPFGVDVAAHDQWVPMCSLSSDSNLNDAMPQLVSESAVQQPFLYTSSSEGYHDADSSGSSERDGPFSCLGGSSSDEISWRSSDVLQSNLGGSLLRLPLQEKLSDRIPSVANVGALDSYNHALSSLVSVPVPALEALPLRPVSWMPPSTTQSDNGSMVSNVVNQHIPSLDPFGASLSNHSNGAQLYKRQRASNPLDYMSSRPMSQPSSSLFPKGISTRSPVSDYPMTSVNITNALHRDFDVSRRQTVSGLPSKLGFCEGAGGLTTKSHQLHNDLRSHRKQNVTSVEPQSVAARHRRKKISERITILEKLIPGGNKMDTASMLDESIEYVKFLKLQVQLLESLGDVSEEYSTASTALLRKEHDGRELEGFDTKTGSASHASQGCKTMHQVRPAASPFILSEVLQQQLFKQKLCLVALRQCPPAALSMRSGTYA